MKRNPLAIAGLVLTALFALCALFAPLVAPQDPAQIDLPARLASPSAAHWLGTDELGRDLLSRGIYGARICMLVATSVVAVTLSLRLIVSCAFGSYFGVAARIF